MKSTEPEFELDLDDKESVFAFEKMVSTHAARRFPWQIPFAIQLIFIWVASFNARELGVMIAVVGLACALVTYTYLFLKARPLFVWNVGEKIFYGSTPFGGSIYWYTVPQEYRHLFCVVPGREGKYNQLDKSFTVGHYMIDTDPTTQSYLYWRIRKVHKIDYDGILGIRIRYKNGNRTQNYRLDKAFATARQDWYEDLREGDGLSEIKLDRLAELFGFDDLTKHGGKNTFAVMLMVARNEIKRAARREYLLRYLNKQIATTNRSSADWIPGVRLTDKKHINAVQAVIHLMTMNAQLHPQEREEWSQAIIDTKLPAELIQQIEAALEAIAPLKQAPAATEVAA